MRTNRWSIATVTIVVAICLNVRGYSQVEVPGGNGPLGSIRGYVVDQKGKPVAHLTVRLDRVGRDQRFELKTDDNGNYVQTGLEEGEYELSIIKDGRSFVRSTRLDFRQNIKKIIRATIGEPPVIETEIPGSGDAMVNFDLRLLQPYDTEQTRRVTVRALQIPRRAQEELAKSFETNDDVEAQRHLEKAISIAPNYAEALNNLGIIYNRRKQYSQAQTLFERALSADPELISARINLGDTCFQLKQYDRALAENLRVLESHPNDALAHFRAGRALIGLNRIDEAIAHLKRAKELEPASSFLPGYFLATVYDDLGQTEAAIVEFAEFLKANPEYPTRRDVEYRIRQLCDRRSVPVCSEIAH